MYKKIRNVTETTWNCKKYQVALHVLIVLKNTHSRRLLIFYDNVFSKYY